jgi:outer membrane protein assembly factor BamB
VNTRPAALLVALAVRALLLDAAPARGDFPLCYPAPLGAVTSALPLTTGLVVSTDLATPIGFIGSGNLLEAYDPVRNVWLWSTAMSGTIIGDPLAAKLEIGLVVVLVPLSGCQIACVRASDGFVMWVKDLRTGTPDPGDALAGTPAIQLRALSDSTFRANVPNDLVFAATRYVSTSLNRVYALNAKDGSTRWVFNLAGTRNMDAASAGPVVDAARNVVYVGTDQSSPIQNSLWALSSMDGTRAWPAFGVTAGRITQRPLLAGGRLYTTGADNVLRATDCAAAPGTLIWSLALASDPVGAPTLAPDVGTTVLIAMACDGDVMRSVVDEGTFAAETTPLTGVASSPVFLPGAGRFFARVPSGDVQEYDTATHVTFGFPATLCGDPAAHLALCHFAAEAAPWRLAVAGGVGPSGYLTQLCVPWDYSLAPGGCTVSVPAADFHAEATLAPPNPNPMATRARFAFSTARSCRVTVLVSDVQGRRVRSLAEDAAAAGGRSLVWDGRDEAGRRAPSGLYTARLMVDGVATRIMRTVLLLR